MRKLAIGLAAAFMLATIAAPVVATKPDPGHKVAICHRTASDTNPYVFIEVDEASLAAHYNNLPGHPEKHGRNDFPLIGPGPFSNDDCYCGDGVG